MVDNISSTASSTQTAANTSTPNIMGKDDFMKLMITQLKNQDPLNPMDGSQYAAQLAQFSSLEQLTNLNDSVNKSIDANYFLTQSINNTLTTTLIGKDVKLLGNKIPYSDQQNITIGYNLPSDAASVKVNIYDKSGALVKSYEDAENSTGEHKLSWDFTDNDGNNVVKGDYTFEVVASNSAGDPITLDQYQIGSIDGVRFTESGTKLLVDNVEYEPSDILEILNSSQSDGN